MDFNNMEDNVDPLQLLPEEIWREILNYLLDDPLSVLYTQQTCSLFKKLLEDVEEAARLAEIFPFLVKYLDVKGLKNVRALSKCNQLTFDYLVENAHLVRDHENRVPHAIPNRPPMPAPNYDYVHLNSLSNRICTSICGLRELERFEADMSNQSWRSVRKMKSLGNTLYLGLSVNMDEEVEEDEGLEDEEYGDDEDLAEEEDEIEEEDEGERHGIDENMDENIPLERGVRLLTNLRSISILHVMKNCDDQALFFSHMDTYLLFRTLMEAVPLVKKFTLELVNCNIIAYDIDENTIDTLRLHIIANPLPQSNRIESLCIKNYYFPAPFIVELHRRYGTLLKWIELAQGSNFVDEFGNPLGQLEFGKLSGASLSFHGESFPFEIQMKIHAPNLVSLDLSYDYYEPFAQQINYFWKHCFCLIPTFPRMTQLKLGIPMDFLTEENVVARTLFPQVKSLKVKAWFNQLPIRLWTTIFPRLDQFVFHMENEVSINCKEFRHEVFMLLQNRGNELDLWKSDYPKSIFFRDAMGRLRSLNQ